MINIFRVKLIKTKNTTYWSSNSNKVRIIVCVDNMLEYSPNKHTHLLLWILYYSDFTFALQGTNLGFHRLVRATSKLMVGMLAYMTLQCTDGCFYEAKVYRRFSNPWELYIFRLAKHYPRYFILHVFLSPWFMCVWLIPKLSRQGFLFFFWRWSSWIVVRVDER